MYLAKIAMDIIAKHAPDFIGVLDEDAYKLQLWNHKPLTDFWRIGRQTAKKFERIGITTMGGIAALAARDENLLYRIYSHIWTDFFPVKCFLLRGKGWVGRRLKKFRQGAEN